MKLIINADDFGMSRSINEAIIELAKIGTLSSTGVMINMPFSDEVIKLLPISNFGIGLHVNLTEGRPVSNPSDINSLVQSSGYFFPKREFLIRQKKGLIHKSHIEKEILAQFQKLKTISGDRITHFDSHQGALKNNLILDVLIKIVTENDLKLGLRVYKKYFLITKNNIPVITQPGIDTLFQFPIKRHLAELYFNLKQKKLKRHFKLPHGSLAVKSFNNLELFQYLIRYSESTFPNYVLEIQCHPSVSAEGLENTTMKEIRVEEYKMLKSENFFEAIKNYNLTTFFHTIS